jgi:hypothetical protein
VTAGLKIIGGDADVDNFVQQTYATPHDIEAEVPTSTPRYRQSGSRLDIHL